MQLEREGELRFIAHLLCVCALVASPVRAETSLIELDTLDKAQQWAAVGRINVRGIGFCTGTLISPTRVLTAAHCIYDQSTGERAAPGDIMFLADFRNGKAEATRKVRRTATHPRYSIFAEDAVTGVSYDMAILELDSPIQLAGIRPFELATQPERGNGVSVVSYAANRSETPSLEELCHVLARKDATVVLSCDVDFGSSGSPVFTIGPDGIARIVTIITAMVWVEGEKVALGASLEMSLSPLFKRITANDWDSAQSPAIVQNLNSDIGAKFIKP